MSKSRCKWCDKSILKGKFCNIYHRQFYQKFRNGFNAEMYYLKNKIKAEDSAKFKMVRNYLTKHKTIMK